jgi:adenosylhomocysteine nucleosidase
MSMIALLGAYSQEIAGLRRQMAVEEVVDSPVCRIYRGRLKGKPCILVLTGIGRRRADKATQFVLERFPVTALISIGFAGALTPDLKIGEVVVCSTVRRASEFEKVEGQAEAYAADPNLLPPASSGPGDGSTRFLAGTSVTTPGVVSGARAKQELGREYRAQIVDMESYWIAGVASARRVPFIAIRSISDTLHDDLRAIDHILDSEGRVLWKGVMPYFLLHPHHLPSMFTAFRNMRRAETNLTAFIGDLVARM